MVKLGEIGISLYGVKIWNFLKFYFFYIFVSDVMVVQKLENLKKSGNEILVRENLENLENSGNFTKRVKNVVGNNAYSYWIQGRR